MKVGDLVRLHATCKNGPAVMHVLHVDDFHITAIALQGPTMGKTIRAAKSNVFALVDYDKAMERHYEKYENR